LQARRPEDQCLLRAPLRRQSSGAARQAESQRADDRIFRVDHADLRECAELVTDRNELATLTHK
jgi:hypothetical protein